MSQRSPRRHLLARLGLPCVAVAALAAGRSSCAQISLSTAVELALQNNPRVKLAQTDVTHAKAVLAETKEVYVPVVATTAGVGKSTGAPLEPPVVFSIAAQSLVFSFSQRDYVRAAHSGLASAELSLEVARTDVAEDAVTTYVTLDNALARRAVQAQALAIASRLVSIVEDRFNAGVDPHIELTKARHTEAQIRLQQLLVEDEIANQTEHLARITGLPSAGGLQTQPASIPAMPPPRPADRAAEQRTQGTSAAFAAAQAKEYTAHGDRRYILHPQLSFSANYSRISTAFTTYSEYYPQFGKSGNSLNSLGVGIQITLPLLDMVHRAHSRESAADAAHAFVEAQIQQDQFLEGRQKLRHSAAELAARAELASLDHDLAQDQLDAITVRLRAAAGAATGEQQLSPKDAENARLDERRRTSDMLDAQLELRTAEVKLMREDGSMPEWLGLAIPGAAAAPRSAPPAAPGSAPPAARTPTPASPGTGVAPSNLPSTVGAEPAPGSGSPAGKAPATVPTTGTIPSSLPSAPVANPAPATKPATPPAPPHP